jgi:ABC-type lipoprotein release transport system permease subunit
MWAAWPWARGEVQRGWQSLALVALLAAIAGGGIMAALAGARRADTAIDRHLERANWPEVTAFATEPVPDVVDWLEGDPRVAGTRDIRFLAATPTHLVPGLDGGIGIGMTEASIDGLWVIDGHLPAGPDDVAVGERTAQDEGIHVGDRLPFHFIDGPTLLACATGEGDCGEPQAIGDKRVVGVFRVPADLAPSPYDQGFFLAGPGFVEALGPVDQVAPGRIVGAMLRDPRDATAVAAELSVRMPNGDTTNEVAVLDPARRAAEVHATGLRVAAAAAALAALLVVFQAVGRQVGSRRDEIETLAALGLTRGTRVLASAAPAFLAAAVAGLAAMGVAVVASMAFPFGLARRADAAPGMHADWVVLGLGAILVTAAVAGAGLVAGWRWTAVRVAGGRSPDHATFASRLTSLFSLGPVHTTGVRFALEGGRRATRVPTGQVAAAVAVALAVVIGGLVVRASLSGLLETPSRYGAGWDFQIALPRTPETDDVVREVAADDRVDGAAVVTAGELTIMAEDQAPDQVPALGMVSLDGSVSPAVLEGRLSLGPDEVLVGSGTFETLGLSIGDRIDLAGADDDDGEPRRLSAEVVGRVIVPVVGNGDTDRGIVVPLETFDALGGDQLVAELDAESALLLRIPDRGDRSAVKSELEQTYGAFVETPFRQASVTVLEELDTVPLLLMAFTAVLGALAATHALSVSVRRRGRDLAVLRALGFGPGQASGVVRWQSLTFAAVALIVGIPMGIIGGRLVWRAIAGSSNVLPVVDLPVAWIAGVAAVSVLTAMVLAVRPGLHAARLRPAEALRSE